MLYSDVCLKGLDHTSQVLPNVDGVVGWRCMHFAYDEILTEWPLKSRLAPQRDPNLHITHDMSIHEHDSCYEMCTEHTVSCGRLSLGSLNAHVAWELVPMALDSRQGLLEKHFSTGSSTPTSFKGSKCGEWRSLWYLIMVLIPK